MRTNQHCLRVALVWNGVVFKEKTYQLTSVPTITVGEDTANMFVVPAQDFPDIFPMFERSKHGYFVRVPEGTRTEITRDGEEVTWSSKPCFDDHVTSTQEWDLSPGDWGTIHLGATTSIFFQVMDRMPHVPLRNPFSNMEWALLGVTCVSALFHGAFLLLANLMFEPIPKLETLEIRNLFVEIGVDDVEDPPEEIEEDLEEDDAGKVAAEGDAGAFGVEDQEIPESKIPEVDGALASEIDAHNIGAVKALSSGILNSGPLQSVFGQSESFDSRMNVAMTGGDSELEIGRGVGGLTLRGTGTGGGGPDGAGRIGALGKVETGKKGIGAKVKRKKQQKRKPPVIRPGKVQIGDFCDASNVRRVVGAKSNAIRYCFEKELQLQPKLSGKIITQWSIGLDGKVLRPGIASSTMGNKNVEGCITRVIKRMRFQKPKGGICIINYPFVFSGLD